MMSAICGSVVFVTGANRKKGIGRALVEEAIRRGAKKVYATGRDVSQLEDLVAQFEGKVVAVELDVTNPEHIKRVALEASDTQILINNAGACGSSGCCHNHDEEVARQELEVNYFGPLRLIRAFSDTLIRNEGGAIVNVVSIGALWSFPPTATYSASKAALHSMTHSVRVELAPQGVAVIGVYPGPTDTDMADGVEMTKASPLDAAIRVFDGMEQGAENITTDPFADGFVGYLRKQPEAIAVIRREFG